MTQANVRLASMDDNECIGDSEFPDIAGISPLRNDNEASAVNCPSISVKMSKSTTKGKEKKISRLTRSNKKAEFDLLEDRMEERMRQNIETRFASFEDRILGLLSVSLNRSSVSATVSSNTTGVSGTQVQIQPTNNCTIGASSVANIISSDFHEEICGQNRQSCCEDDVLSIQPGQVERDLIGCNSENGSSVSQSGGNVIDGNSEARFIKYKASDSTEQEQNLLSEIFGEDAHSGKVNNISGISLDQCQSDILSNSWRSEHPDRITAYKDNYRSSFPLNDNTAEFLKVPSLDDIVETFLVKRFSSKACFKKARSLHTQHWKEIERIAYQAQVAAKLGISVNLYMQQALRVLLEELKTENPNIDLAIQTVRDAFAMSTKTLDQLGRTGAYSHIIRRKATIVDMGLDSVKDIAKQAELLPLTGEGVLGSAFEEKLKDRKEKLKEMKDLVPELETKRMSFQGFKRKTSYSGQYGDIKQRRYNEPAKNFNNRSYGSGEFRSMSSQNYGSSGHRGGFSYRGTAQNKRTGVSSFRNKRRN